MPDTRPTPRITVVTCLRDEGSFLVDWVAHLRALGVDRVLAYTNDCRDGTEALVEALAPEGVIHCPQGDILGDGGAKPQWRAMADAWDHPACAEADWLLHIDPDEYIALNGPTDLPGLIDAMPGAEAIALPWRLFGCAGRLEAGDGSTPVRFDRAAPPGMAFPALGSFIKTLFRRDGPFAGFGIHRPQQSRPPVFCDDTGRRDDDLAADGKRILLWRGGIVVEDRLVQLNHYSTRSIHEFLVKRGRGLPNHVGKAIDLEYWVERNFNETRCAMIKPQLPVLAQVAARLRALPGVAGAEGAARDWHRAALSQVLATPEGAKLCGRLVLAAGSRAPEAGLGRMLLAQYAAAQKARS
ncbi:glycosyltransferase family 2 protein [Jannaschia pohangensis]|uniref:Glycosyl transferase family 2 n=1 Tax=Jannaschia pohangensis TaxID=390807 RepID=A0A1I3GAQ8_9RHOB|nr:glycosyltransferase family 2 protein [Jannaschia pohangensis]SFI20312.1 Glycosyl transferase family 2 [Jannaschia pohangensis]